ncbi:iron-sulfur cluster carrier protein ApbC [Parathalassolituus penaei]|uniref:Iron-sulfur cluster carrier protein n=1 Tax=Parathalassolituus penaei TaxID=2997323 RepID=A0A9X3ITP3_9GAMM|nr:iron-sulfur cluster carrier protein ApbC [Parathalassolituus penaei]MCY0966530.1 iron-sulfur cluster carrier protein ApbC [Parathalassolituus penaei]
MTQLTRSLVERALAGYTDPYLETDLVTAQAVRDIRINGTSVAVDIQLDYPSEYLKNGVAQLLQTAVENLDGCSAAIVNIQWEVAPHKSHEGGEALAGVKNVIAVASGKGGVGKSTTTVNLALALARDGARVGLLDADIYGPSQGIMLGVADGTRPQTIDNKWFVPIEAHGVKSMSMAYLVTEDTPMVWRGPMVAGALMQIMSQTAWGELDYLLIDMPPGTGDIQLTLSQKFPVSGSVIVTTPQDIALADAKKGVEMFRKVGIPVLGIIENMSMHICSSCGHAEHIFGEDGGERLAKAYQTRVLGSLPLAKYIREQSDAGTPVVAADDSSEVAMMYRHAARRMAVELARGGKAADSMPVIEVSDD